MYIYVALTQKCGRLVGLDWILVFAYLYVYFGVVSMHGCPMLSFAAVDLDASVGYLQLRVVY